MVSPHPPASPHSSSELEAWDRFVAQHPAGNLLQTTQWGRLKSEFGWDWELVTVGGDVATGGHSSPEAGAMVLYRTLPLGLGCLAYVPRGPLVAWTARERVTELFAAVDAAARRRHAWACWIEPEVLDGGGRSGVPEGEVELLLADLGYRRATRTIQPRSTIVVNIASTEADILMAMKSKTRYNIRLAERKGVVVHEGTLADVDTFYDLMEETGERDAFGIHTRAYYRKALELFAAKGQVALMMAEYEGEPLAGLLVFAVGRKSWYIAGASSDRHRNLMPAYAVQWAAIRWAKALGCTTYDLWGIPDAGEAMLEAEFTERSDGLWGVYRFKRGFGGDVVRYTGMWERALNPLYPLVSRFYQRLR
jgi:peptidoglycan pentaglycine glycine transferase (the first glycine)